MEITDEQAKEALRIYVQGAGSPHDAMRKAILSVLPTEPERVADRYTPSAVTDEALDAANIALSIQGVELKDKIRPGEQLSIEHLRIVLTSVLEAALPHLTALNYDEAFRRGVAIGKAEAEARQIDGRVLETSGPSDYEVWRDALLLAATITGQTRNLVLDDPDRRRFILTADWFMHQLTRGRIDPGALADDPEEDDSVEAEAQDPYFILGDGAKSASRVDGL
jgi:hypothetical protein